MLPFSSIRQAKRFRTENSITEDLWNTSILAVAAEHSLPNARADLELLWKQRLISKGGAAAAGGDRSGPARRRTKLAAGPYPYQRPLPADPDPGPEPGPAARVLPPYWWRLSCDG